MSVQLQVEAFLCLGWDELIKLANKKAKRTMYKIQPEENQVYKLQRESKTYHYYLELDDTCKLSFIISAVIGKSANKKEEVK